MDCKSTSVELETIVARINRNEINLQPEFQRGEVWNKKKKQKLIDSILRGWTIPPIHFIKNENKIDDVLDGQQRLVSIRDFCNNEFAIDGSIPPNDDGIMKLNKMYYKDIPDSIRIDFNRYSINLVYLENYKPDESAELFDRLNQPMKLSTAEQRNAYMGKARSQIKYLVTVFEEEGANIGTIGFSNYRLVYDDLIARFCYIIKTQSIDKKILTSDITNIYRSVDGYDSDVIVQCESIIKKFMRIIILCKSPIKLNVPSVFSWWLYLYQHPNKSEQALVYILYYFEISCDVYRGLKQDDKKVLELMIKLKNEQKWIDSLFNLYIQKLSIASTDSSSIKTRDFLLNLYSGLINEDNILISRFNNLYIKADCNFVDAVNQYLIQNNWGTINREK